MTTLRQLTASWELAAKIETAGGVSQEEYSTHGDVGQAAMGSAAGNALLWAVDDSLATLRLELETRGLSCPQSAILAAREAMMGASYMRTGCGPPAETGGPAA